VRMPLTPQVVGRPVRDTSGFYAEADAFDYISLNVAEVVHRAFRRNSFEIREARTRHSAGAGDKTNRRVLV
jgi:hypothetical protein